MTASGLDPGGAGSVGVGGGADGAGNLAEQAVGAALRYRAYAPVLDKLLQEVGFAEHGITGILSPAQVAAAAPTATPAASKAS